LIVVLESVGARYIYSRIGNDFAMPRLNSRRSMSLIFTDVYAHAPLSNKSLFALLAGMYPRISYRYETEAYLKIPLNLLSSEFHSRNYRTAFFMSGDFRFQRADRFLQGRGFDKLADMNTISCGNAVHNTSDDEWRYNDSVDDGCTAKALEAWIDERPAEPFFAVLWTGNTHWPYSFIGKETDYGVDNRDLNRYANSMRASDEAVDGILTHLTERNLLSSTLVVVLGDHGQAFNQHGNSIHGQTIYDEELHIPLILMNPVLFKGEENKTVGGIVDIAPTIMDLLRLPGADMWQGRSLFDSGRSGRVYFFCPTRDMMLGFRDGRSKYLLNSTRDKLEVYDLLEDPAEHVDISSQLPGIVTTVKGRLAAWVQYQEQLFTRLALAPRRTLN
jgi:arylsulfatase A-like enzyme